MVVIAGCSTGSRLTDAFLYQLESALLTRVLVFSSSCSEYRGYIDESVSARTFNGFRFRPHHTKYGFCLGFNS